MEYTKRVIKILRVSAFCLRTAEESYESVNNLYLFQRKFPPPPPPSIVITIPNL